MTSYLTSNSNQLPLKKPFEGNIKYLILLCIITKTIIEKGRMVNAWELIQRKSK